MLKGKLRKIALALTVVIGVGYSTPAMASSSDDSGSVNSNTTTGDILALGSDLTTTQKNALLEYFDAPEGTEIISVTDEIIIAQLGLDADDPDNYKGGCYSSAYVQLADDDNGINVEAKNLTEVTESMLMNALITSGITNANVKVSAPFAVTGTSALAGILEGVETVGGYEISLKQKETAQKEIETTMEVAEEIGDEEASSIINDIKTEVIKENPETEEEIAQIVQDVANQYNVNISVDASNAIINLMTDVNDLNLDYSQLKDTLKDASNKFKETFEELGLDFKDEGMWEKVKDFFSDLVDGIINFFKNFASSNDEESTDDSNTVDTTTDTSTSDNVDTSDNGVSSQNVESETNEGQASDDSSVNTESNDGEETNGTVEDTTSEEADYQIEESSDSFVNEAEDQSFEVSSEDTSTENTEIQE